RRWRATRGRRWASNSRHASPPPAARCSMPGSSSSGALRPRFNKDAGRAGTLWYHRRLATVLSERLAGSGQPEVALADELARTVQWLSDAVTARVGSETVRTDEYHAPQREDATRAGLR